MAWWIEKGGTKRDDVKTHSQTKKKPKNTHNFPKPLSPHSFFPHLFSRLFPLSLSFPPSSLPCALAVSITISTYYSPTTHVHTLNQQYPKLTQHPLLFIVFLSCPISLLSHLCSKSLIFLLITLSPICKIH